MNRIKNNFLSKFVICIMCFMLVFSCSTLKTSISFADDDVSKQNLEIETHSVFIHTPTHSAIHNNKLFFVDEFDGLIKIYDLTQDNEKFLEKTLSIESYSVLDTAYSNGYMFILAKQNQTTKIIAVKLDESNDSPAKQIEVSENIDSFDKIDISSFGTDSETKYLLSLTPKINSTSTNPLVIVLNNNLETTKLVTITPVGDTEDNTLIKFLTLKSSETNYYFIFGFNHILFYSPCTLSTIESSSGTESASLTQFPGDAIPKDSELSISDVNLIQVSNEQSADFETAFVLTFSSTIASENNATTSVYSYSINNDDATQTRFSSLINMASHTNTTCISVSDKYLIYPNEQTIVYQEIVKKNETSCTKKQKTIKNPEVVASYSLPENYTYYTANKTTTILPTPWSDTPLHVVNNNDDVVVIGTGKIKNTDSEIIDYNLCLYTAYDNNMTLTNYIGFIPKTDLSQKSPYVNNDYSGVFTVAKGTMLYSQPTISKINTPKTDLTQGFEVGEPKPIADNSKIKLESTICKYTSNGRVFVRVLVNETETGFIDADKIIFPNPSVDFIVTNASIKSDDTKVYNEDGTIFDTLNKGFRVRINGTRNTKTGYTSISYNDEYGNVYTGYILTDTIKANTWSTLQILGSVLIAINIGLLILILIFKKRKIGYHGEKYQKAEKPNYKEDKIIKSEE